jgi:TatD DNase family protein
LYAARTSLRITLRRIRLAIDSHIHLDAPQYADPSGVIKRARAAGVEALVVPGTGRESNLAALALARRYPGFVYAAVGLHPERFELGDDDVDDALRLIERERGSICAIGEVGLPHYGSPASEPAVRERAAEVLRRFARKARETGLALILHAPHASAAQALRIIRGEGAQRAVFHWHKADPDTTGAIVESGYWVSFTPEVAYRERDQRTVRLVPLGRMLVETDGPWRYGGPFAGRETEPALIADAIEAIARATNTARAVVAEETTRNAKALFSIP